MAVYLHIFNLIIKRQTVIDKYAGGVDQFRIDYDLPHSEINQEDDELFSLGQMDVDEFDFDRLIAKGLNCILCVTRHSGIVVIMKFHPYKTF